MADSPFNPFTAGFAPGLEFMQSLMKNAGAALPGAGQWVTPTLDPQELEKRISELRTVQFWLEQNARMLATTIQALEVQKMTLSTLRTMNVRMDDLRETLTAQMPGAAPATPTEGEAGATPAVDPMRWWGALTEQFTQLTTQALRDGAAFAGQAGAPPAAGEGTACDGEDTAGAPAPTPATAAPARKAAPRRRGGSDPS